MPPLATLLLGVVALIFCARTFAEFGPTEFKQLPFIADITHGICPRCGVSHPRKEVLQEDHELFWQGFRCGGCGYSIDVHLR